MCLSFRPALALVFLLIVLPFARGQDQSAGSRVSGSIAQPIGGSQVLTNKDKPDGGEKKKALDEASAADRLSDAGPSLGDPLVRVLVIKGILSAEEGNSISSSGTPV